MQTLIEGYRRFREGRFQEQRQRLSELAAQGQAPKALIIACCDSRVDPQMIFDTGPGDLFVIRNVANLVPPYHPNADYHGTSAALEFGITVLEVPDVVVMGHGGCGGVRALLQGSPTQGDFIGRWMDIVSEDVKRTCCCGADPADPEVQRAAELEVVRRSLANLTTFPWVRERVADGRLRLHGAFFELASGTLLWLGPPSNEFRE